jgi:hypothetical protein
MLWFSAYATEVGARSCRHAGNTGPTTISSSSWQAVSRLDMIWLLHLLLLALLMMELLSGHP